MDFLSIRMGKTNRFVVSLTRDKYDIKDSNGKLIASSLTKREMLKKLKELGIEE